MTYAKHTDGTIINPCEKPPELARWFVSTIKPRDPWKLRPLIGGGAGGDFIGAAQVAMNVVCVEKDERQFLALLKTLIQFADSQKRPPCREPTALKVQPRALLCKFTALQKCSFPPIRRRR